MLYWEVGFRILKGLSHFFFSSLAKKASVREIFKTGYSVIYSNDLLLSHFKPV